MRKVLLSAIVLFAFGSANAQDIKFGAKAGANFSTVKQTITSAGGLVDSKNKMLVGLHVGGFAEFKFSDKFSLQPELLYSIQGSKFDYNAGFPGIFSVTGERKLNLSYISLPVMAKFYATPKLFLAAGPQISYLVSAKEDVTFAALGNSQSNVDVKDNYKSIDFTAGIGAGYFFTDNIFAEARYNIGFSNIAEPRPVDDGGQFQIEGTEKTRNIQLSLGYRF